MKLSAKLCYGTRALIDLAAHLGPKPLLLKEIAARQGVSLPYLARLTAPLVAAGLVRTTRGARGGVRLAKPPAEVTLREVVQLLEGPIASTDCASNTNRCADPEASCAVRDAWDKLERAVFNVLESMTLQDLARKQREMEEIGEPMYHI